MPQFVDPVVLLLLNSMEYSAPFGLTLNHSLHPIRKNHKEVSLHINATFLNCTEKDPVVRLRVDYLYSRRLLGLHMQVLNISKATPKQEITTPWEDVKPVKFAYFLKSFSNNQLT